MRLFVMLKPVVLIRHPREDTPVRFSMAALQERGGSNTLIDIRSIPAIPVKKNGVHTIGEIHQLADNTTTRDQKIKPAPVSSIIYMNTI